MVAKLHFVKRNLASLLEKIKAGLLKDGDHDLEDARLKKSEDHADKISAGSKQMSLDSSARLSPDSLIPSPEELERIGDLIEQVDGWCTPYKASVLYKLALLEGVQLGVEIGIYGGKSLFPVAQAFKHKGYGIHYGIEAWDNEVAVETPTNEANDAWWRDLDLKGIKQRFLENMMRLEMGGEIAVIQAPSDVSFQLFSSHRFRGKVDLLHIDGAHSVNESLHDVSNWTKIVRPGGFVILDDINWPTVHLAHDYLKRLGKELMLIDQAELGHFSVVQLAE